MTGPPTLSTMLRSLTNPRVVLSLGKSPRSSNSASRSTVSPVSDRRKAGELLSQLGTHADDGIGAPLPDVAVPQMVVRSEGLVVSELGLPVPSVSRGGKVADCQYSRLVPVSR